MARLRLLTRIAALPLNWNHLGESTTDNGTCDVMDGTLPVHIANDILQSLSLTRNKHIVLFDKLCSRLVIQDFRCPLSTASVDRYH